MQISEASAVGIDRKNRSVVRDAAAVSRAIQDISRQEQTGFTITSIGASGENVEHVETSTVGLELIHRARCPNPSIVRSRSVERVPRYDNARDRQAPVVRSEAVESIESLPPHAHPQVQCNGKDQKVFDP